MLTNGLSSGAVRMAPQRRQERHCGRRWQHGAARRPAGAARPSLTSEAAARENTLRRDTVPMSRKHGAACTTYCTAAAPRRAQTSRRRAATMPFGGLCGMGACPLGCSTTAVRRAAAHDVSSSGRLPTSWRAGVRTTSPGCWMLIGIYSAVIASILYAVAADSKAKGARGTAASWCAVPAPFARAPQEPAMIDHTSLRAF